MRQSDKGCSRATRLSRPAQESRADLIAGFQLPDRCRAAALFLEAFPGEAAAAERFARAVTDEFGHGLVSTLNLSAATMFIFAV